VAAFAACYILPVTERLLTAGFNEAIMILTLRTALMMAGLALAMLLPPVAPAALAAPLRTSQSPFCLLPGSTNGPGGAPQICGYYDWQACLEAGAIRHANCVVNVDFPGQVVAAPNGWRAVYPGGRGPG
jgi:hypothetical protein